MPLLAGDLQLLDISSCHLPAGHLLKPLHDELLERRLVIELVPRAARRPVEIQDEFTVNLIAPDVQSLIFHMKDRLKVLEFHALRHRFSGRPLAGSVKSM